MSSFGDSDVCHNAILVTSSHLKLVTKTNCFEHSSLTSMLPLIYREFLQYKSQPVDAFDKIYLSILRQFSNLPVVIHDKGRCQCYNEMIWYRLSVKLTRAWSYAVHGFSRRNKFQPIGSYMQIFIISQLLLFNHLINDPLSILSVIKNQWRFMKTNLKTKQLHESKCGYLIC